MNSPPKISEECYYAYYGRYDEKPRWFAPHLIDNPVLNVPQHPGIFGGNRGIPRKILAVEWLDSDDKDSIPSEEEQLEMYYEGDEEKRRMGWYWWKWWRLLEESQLSQVYLKKYIKENYPQVKVVSTKAIKLIQRVCTRLIWRYSTLIDIIISPLEDVENPTPIVIPYHKIIKRGQAYNMRIGRKMPKKFKRLIPEDVNYMIYHIIQDAVWWMGSTLRCTLYYEDILMGCVQNDTDNFEIEDNIQYLNGVLNNPRTFRRFVRNTFHIIY